MTHPDVRERLGRVARDGLGSIRRHGMTQDDLRDLLDSAAKAEADVRRIKDAVAPFAALYDQITAEHGPDWFGDEAQTMRSSLAYPVANSALPWRRFRLASEAVRALTTPSAGDGGGDG